MQPYLIALGIFAMRICDVSVGTVRVIYTIRGRRFASMCLGTLESGIWIFAISRLFKYVDNPISMVGWSVGFGVGTVVGITIEKWIASGHILMRVISTHHPVELRRALMEESVGVTALPGAGRDGEVQILFVVAPRRRGNELLSIVQQIDPDAFITIDPISQAIGGYMPLPAEATSMRK
jgi:uncharacterized protein YebE (UPF0316 family)